MKILILPGDAIGPEITAVTKAALEALDCRFDLGLDLVEREIGLVAFKNVGRTMPEDVMDEIRDTPTTILGPISGYILASLWLALGPFGYILAPF